MGRHSYGHPKIIIHFVTLLSKFYRLRSILSIFYYRHSIPFVQLFSFCSVSIYSVLFSAFFFPIFVQLLTSVLTVETHSSCPVLTDNIPYTRFLSILFHFTQLVSTNFLLVQQLLSIHFLLVQKLVPTHLLLVQQLYPLRFLLSNYYLFYSFVCISSTPFPSLFRVYFAHSFNVCSGK